MPITEDNFWRIVTILIAATGPVWLYYKERKAAKDKAQAVTSASNDERQRSNQVFGQVGESKTQATLLETYAAMSNHLITSNNGHMTALTEAVVDGFKETIQAVTKSNGEIIMALLDGFREGTVEQTKQAAAINQLNYFLQERAGRSLSGGDMSMLKSAELRTEAVRRSDDIVQAVDLNIQAKKDDKASHVSDESTIEVTGKKVD